MNRLTSITIDGIAQGVRAITERLEIKMDVKVHWIIDGVAELDVETMEEAEQKVDSLLREVIADNPKLVELLGARAIQGKAYLPGSEEDLQNETPAA